MTTRMERLERAMIQEHGWRVSHINEWGTDELIDGTFMINVLHITVIVSVRQGTTDTIITPRSFFYCGHVEHWQAYGIAEDVLKVIVSELVKLGHEEIYLSHFRDDT